MKMSLAYMGETAEAMAANGWSLQREVSPLERDGALIYTAHRMTLERGADRRLVLECLVYADGREAYFVEIDDYAGLSSFSFPLDSWKHREDRVEFKYYVHPETGLGLSFVLSFPRGHLSPPSPS